MFVAGQSIYAGLVFSFLSFLVAIPSAIKVFNWTATLYKGSISLRDADALRLRLHRPVHDRRPDRTVPRRRWASTSTCTTRTSSSRTSTTSWSAARSWATSAGCTTGGRRSPAGCIPRPGRKFAALLVFVGFNLTFFPQFIVGYLGMPRRYHAYPPEFQVLQRAVDGRRVDPRGRLLAAARLLHLVAASPARRRPPIRGAPGLEWEIPSPPPTENFTVTPIVTERHARVRARARRSALSDGHSHAEHFPGPHAPAAPVHDGRGQPDESRRARASSEAAAPFRRHGAAGRGVRRSACGCSWSPKSCSSAACSWPTWSTGRPSRSAFQEASHHLDMPGARQHRRPDRQLADDGAGGARGADRASPKMQVMLAARDDVPRRRSFLGVKVDRVHRQVRRTTSCPARTSSRPGQYPAAARRCSTRSTSA